VDPNKVLAAFESLRMKEGWALRAYQFVEGGNGNAFVYALPIDVPLPSPEDCPRSRSHFLEPPVPPSALSNFMEAVEGDGSPFSYLSASFAARELAEIGAMWHGLTWSTHQLLSQNPLSPPRRKTARRSSVMLFPDPENGPWEWTEEPPSSWIPTVTMNPKTVRVTFYTYSGLGEQAVYRHVDTFRIGSYRFSSKETVITKGPGGFIF
jgi:hypothetical protein